jgi:hypothetical protein
MIRALLLAFSLLMSAQAGAVQFIKCGSVEGKSFWSSWGKQARSGEKEIRQYPIDFVIFSAPQTLQDRIIYYKTKDALQIPVEMSPSGVKFSFPAGFVDGVATLMESFDLRLYSPKDLTGFVGSWTTMDMNGKVIQKIQTMCSVL